MLLEFKIYCRNIGFGRKIESARVKRRLDPFIGSQAEKHGFWQDAKPVSPWKLRRHR